MTVKILFVVFLGLAGGIAVGSGFVAFLTVLGIIPRLTQLSKTMKKIEAYQWGVTFGAVAGGLMSLWDPTFHLPSLLLIPLGAFSGVFVGMMAAALTEVLNVFPILAKRIRIEDRIVLLMMAFVLGKILGSLFQWIYFVDG
jgi:stage V sporulation protein AB